MVLYLTKILRREIILIVKIIVIKSFIRKYGILNMFSYGNLYMYQVQKILISRQDYGPDYNNYIIKTKKKNNPSRHVSQLPTIRDFPLQFASTKNPISNQIKYLNRLKMHQHV